MVVLYDVVAALLPSAVFVIFLSDAVDAEVLIRTLFSVHLSLLLLVPKPRISHGALLYATQDEEIREKKERREYGTESKKRRGKT